MARRHTPLSDLPSRVVSAFDTDQLTPDERTRRAQDPRAIREPGDEAIGETDAVAVVESGASVEQGNAEGWSVRWVVAPQSGTFVVRALTIEPTTEATPPGGLTASMLRDLSPAAAANQVADTDFDADSMEASLMRNAKTWIAENGPQTQGTTGRGRPKLTDELLAQVAIAYLEEFRHGRGILDRLAARFDRPPTTMRDWVRKARVRQWLGPAPKQGSRGGGPGPRLIEFLAHEEGTNE